MAGAFVIFPGDTTWTLAAVSARQVRTESVAVPQGPLAAKEMLLASLARLGHRGEAVIAALSSAHCMAASIDAAALPRRGRREAIRYALEEKLPIAAEDFVAAFVEGPREILGVAAPLAVVTPLMSVFETLDLKVAALVPAALLASSSPQMTEAAARFDGVCLLRHEQTVELVELRGGRPAAWLTSPAESSAIQRQLTLLRQRGAAAAVLAVGMPDELTPTGDVRRVSGGSLVEHASLGAAARGGLARELDLMADLRARSAGATAAGGARAMLLAAVLAAVAVPGSMLWRAHRYDVEAERHRAAQQAMYEKRFNTAAPSAGIVRFFESELRAMTKAQAGGARGGEHDSSLPVLRDLMRAVPASARLRVQRLSVTPQRLEMQAEAASKADAYAVQQAMASVSGMSAELTRIEDAGGAGECRFVLVATAKAAGTAGVAR